MATFIPPVIGATSMAVILWARLRHVGVAGLHFLTDAPDQLTPFRGRGAFEQGVDLLLGIEAGGQALQGVFQALEPLTALLTG